MIPPNNSSLFWFALWASLSSFAGVGAYYSERDWLKLALGILAAILLLVAAANLFDWIGRAWDYHAYRARIRGATTPAFVFAKAVADLSPAQAALVSRYQTIEIQGILSNVEVLWVYRGLDGKDIPVDWAGRYLELSASRYPELYPVRGQEGDEFWDWKDTELARAFTKLLVAHGFATPASGRSPAVLRIGLEELAGKLGLVN